MGRLYDEELSTYKQSHGSVRHWLQLPPFPPILPHLFSPLPVNPSIPLAAQTDLQTPWMQTLGKWDISNIQHSLTCL